MLGFVLQWRRFVVQEYRDRLIRLQWIILQRVEARTLRTAFEGWLEAIQSKIKVCTGRTLVEIVFCVTPSEAF